MRRSLPKLLAVCLLLLAVLQPPRPAPTPLRSYSRSTPLDWSPLKTAVQVKLWRDTEHWNNTLTLLQQAAKKPQDGSGRAMSEQAERQGVTYDDVWSALARCESGGNPATNTGNGFYGAFQFTASTWRSMDTGYALASDAPYSVQLDAAQRLQARSGWGQWPACSRKLGLS